MSESYTLEQVPPPAKVPVQDRAAALGLLPGLRVEDCHRPFRCSNCETLSAGPELVCVPDGIRIGDDPKVVSEVCRRSAYNGSGSGWCINCAQRLSGKITVPIATKAAKGFFVRAWDILTGRGL